MSRTALPRIRAQARKELAQLRRDRLTLALAVGLPLVLLFLFGKGVSLDLDNIPLAIRDLDNTPLSRRFIESYAATTEFVLVPSRPDAPLPEALDSGRARAALIIPAHFQRDLLRGAPVAVQVLIDGNDANTATRLRNTAQAMNAAFRNRQLDRPALSPAVRLQTRLWYNPGLSSDRFFGSGALGMVLILFPSLLGALAASREHEQGTLIQVYASTLSAPQWLLGKAIPYILIALLELLLCFLAGVFLYGYRLSGDPTPLALGSLLYLMGAVFFGMAMGNLTGTQSAAIQAVQLGAWVISMLLSGFLFPVSNIPAQLRWISWLLPARHYIDLARDSLLRGGGWASSVRPVLMLALLAGIFFAVNVRRMRRMQFSD